MHEASALASLYYDFESYPEPYGQNLRWLTRDYTRYTIKYGWPMQRQGLIPEEGEIRVQGLRERLVGFNPQNPARGNPARRSSQPVQQLRRAQKKKAVLRHHRDSRRDVVRRRRRLDH